MYVSKIRDVLRKHENSVKVLLLVKQFSARQNSKHNHAQNTRSSF